MTDTDHSQHHNARTRPPHHGKGSAGKYQAANTGSQQCAFCPQGFSFVNTSAPCASCPAGKYQDENAQASAACKFCLAGTYFLNTTQPCQSCPIGWSQPSSNAAQAQCSPDPTTPPAADPTTPMAATTPSSVNTGSTTASAGVDAATTAAPEEEVPNTLESAGSTLVHNSHSSITGLALALLAALAAVPSLV